MESIKISYTDKALHSCSSFRLHLPVRPDPTHEADFELHFDWVQCSCWLSEGNCFIAAVVQIFHKILQTKVALVVLVPVVDDPRMSFD